MARVLELPELPELHGQTPGMIQAGSIARSRRFRAIHPYSERTTPEYRTKMAEWQRNYRKDHPEKKRDKIALRAAFVDSLKVTGCVDCGNKNLSVLDLDHLGDKVRNVSAMLDYSMEKLMVEVAKCEVRCANCHRIKTASRRNGKRNA